MARFIGGRCGWKVSTCSIGRVLLDLPMGVMRERGMARCCMIDNAEWVGGVGGERRRFDAGAGADAECGGMCRAGRGGFVWYRSTERVVACSVEYKI
jgi:hypothetical protein